MPFKLNLDVLLSFFETTSIILAANNKKEIFDKICEMAVKRGGVLMARISTFDEKGKKFFPIAYYAESREAFEYQEHILEESSIDGPYRNSPTAKAFFNKKPVIISNTLEDPSYKVYMKNSEKLGYLSKAAFPIIYNDDVYAVFTVYAKEIDFFNDLLCNVITHILDDAAFSINRLKMDEERELLTEELISLRDRYRIILESTKGAIWEYDAIRKEINFSLEAKKILGIKTSELKKGFKEFYKLMDKDSREKYISKLYDLVKGEREYLEETVKLNLDKNRHIHVLVRGKIIERNRANKVKKIAGFITDISNIVHLNESLHRLNNFYRALSETNQMIIRSKSVDDIGKKTCQIAVTYGDFDMAWFGIYDEKLNDLRTHSFFANDKNGEEYFKKLKISIKKDSPLKVGPAGRAFLRNKPVVINDIYTDEGFTRWLSMAEMAGLRSTAAFPIFYKGKKYGIFSLYSKKIDFFDSEVVSLLEEMAMDIGFAIHKLELEKSIRDAEELWKTALEVANEIVIRFDFNKNRAIKSKKFYELLNYSDNFPETDDALFSLVHPVDQSRVGKKRNDVISGRFEVYTDEVRLKTSSGEYKYFYHHVKVLERNPDGSASKAVGVFLDIDELKRKQSEIENLSKFYQLLAKVNENIFNVESIKKAFKITVENIVEYLGVSHAAVAKVNKKNLTPKVLAYATKDIEAAKILKELGEHVNVAAFDSILSRAFKNKSIDIVNNLKLDKSTKNFYEEYEELNVKSIVCLPIIYENMESDYLIIYSDLENYFDSKKIDLLNNLATNLSHANAKIVSEKLALKRQRELLESERKWKAALDSTNEGVWISYLDTNKMFYSDKWKEMLGYDKQDIPDRLESFYNLVHPEDIGEHKRIIEKCKNGLSKSIENIVRLKAKDGSYKWILVRGRVYKYDINGKPTAIIGTHTDITELNEINEKLLRLNNFYEALLLSNRLLISELNLEAIFSEICKLAVEYGKLMMARVEVVNEQNGTFQQVALYIKDDRCLDYLQEIKNVNTTEDRRQMGYMRAYTSKDIVIVKDFQTDEHVTEVIKKAALKANINSAVAFPLLYKDMVYAVFTLYSDRVNFFDGDILDLINYLANDLSYAIERNIESESRKAFEKQLHLIYQAINNVNEAIIITDENKKIVMVNKSFEPLLGFKEVEVINKDISILNSGRHPNEFFKIMWSVLKNTGHWQGEIYTRLKDGSIIPTWTSITVIKDENNIIRNYICIITDLTGRKEIEDKILYLSNYDSLTGLPNRVLFIDRLEQSIASAKRFNKKFALIYLDIDRFKAINDNLGHNFGDKLLEHIAVRLKSIIRGTDTLSRPTGDEFYIIINDIGDLDDVVTVIRKIFDKISEPFDIEGYKLNITASVGVTVYPEDGQNAGVIMRNAEAALYYAKELGRNTYQFYKAEMTTKSKYAFELKNRLKKALEDGEFVLFYQPKICIKTRQIVGAEALIRWMHPERGLIPPNDFIHIAEYSGLIKQIGEWVIEEACNQLKEWKKKGLPEITVSVNVSSIQFQDRNLKKQVEVNLKKSNILPHQIELELTETIIMKDSETAMQLLNALKAMNILISIDDFGTGYSSLSYLKRFPIDTIKIDRSFISSLTRANGEDTSIVRTIINLGKNLGLKVIAEGVETQEQLELLETWGCDEYQGYYFSKPVPANEFEQLLRKDKMCNN